MKKIKALLVVVCTGVLLTACGNSSQKGVEYLEDGKYDQAIEQFEQAVDKKKNVPVLHRLYGALIVGIGIVAASVSFTVYGTIHARQMTTRSYDINVEKQVDGIDSLNVVLVADLHLGYSIGCDDMRKMAERINALNPDVVIERRKALEWVISDEYDWNDIALNT